jgi:hypothetical protein
MQTSTIYEHDSRSLGGGTVEGKSSFVFVSMPMGMTRFGYVGANMSSDGESEWFEEIPTRLL